MATDRLSATFAALADPTRRAILARLALGETSVSELAKPFDISLPAISRHLKVLEHAGLIARGREAQWRPCRIEPKALQGRRRLARGLSPALGGAPRPPGRLSADAASGAAAEAEAKSRRRSVAERNSIDLRAGSEAIIGIARDRRAARAGVVGVDRSEASGAMVGPGRLYAPRPARSTCKPGGVWRFVMHGPDGRDYENRITFDEIVKPERLRYHHGGGDDVEPVQFRTTVTFEDLGGKTRRHLARRVPVGRRARPRHQGLRRRQGSGADAGAARRICGGHEDLIATLASIDPAFMSSQRIAKESAMQVQSYLFFDGRCEEAIEFYKKALGAKVEMMMRFKEAPGDHKLHARHRRTRSCMPASRIGDTLVMASDGRLQGKPDFGLLAVAQRQGRGRGRAHVRRAGRRRPGAAAAGRDVLLAELRHGAPTSSASAG